MSLNNTKDFFLNKIPRKNYKAALNFLKSSSPCVIFMFIVISIFLSKRQYFSPVILTNRLTIWNDYSFYGTLFSGFCNGAATTKYAIILLLKATNSFEYFIVYANKFCAFNKSAYNLKLLLSNDKIRITVKTLNCMNVSNISWFKSNMNMDSINLVDLLNISLSIEKILKHIFL